MDTERIFLGVGGVEGLGLGVGTFGQNLAQASLSPATIGAFLSKSFFPLS